MSSDRIQVKKGRVTKYAVTHCLISTVDAFEGYPAEVVVNGIVDFVLTLIISENISLESFVEVLHERELEVLGEVGKLRKTSEA